MGRCCPNAERGGRTAAMRGDPQAWHPLIKPDLLLGQLCVFARRTLTAKLWLQIGINLNLRLDDLGFLFALL